MQTETFELIDKAVDGNKKALEGLILEVEDMIYNLSLRMLGSLYDAQDATQEIIIKIITQLSTLLVMSAVLGTAISAAGHFIL
ncbi:RNA polymerase sigma factor [Diplocloster modestus]|uniref:Helix-turn-helix domain-containing protein n=1 Tax=Diplocloster modestus TaxID=2850322 RepID=A0ABS6K1F2_9FIRM|nr:helix-turn-helix domain-containing protein [Diplocloster modestus]MBU9724548.1 helix-turn-helix domain-containing protein [Diplocloster modestus]